MATMTVKEIRALTSLSQIKFCDKYGIPRRTLELWESKDGNIPEYTRKLLERVVKEDVALENNKKGTYVVIRETGGDVYNQFTDNLEKANDEAEQSWNRLTYLEKKKERIHVGYIKKEYLCEDAVDEDGTVDWNAYHSYDTDETMFNSDRLEL